MEVGWNLLKLNFGQESTEETTEGFLARHLCHLDSWVIAHLNVFRPLMQSLDCLIPSSVCCVSPDLHVAYTWRSISASLVFFSSSFVRKEASQFVRKPPWLWGFSSLVAASTFPTVSGFEPDCFLLVCSFFLSEDTGSNTTGLTNNLCGSRAELWPGVCRNMQ